MNYELVAFDYFILKINLVSHQSWFIFTLVLRSEMCAMWAWKDEFLSPNRSKIPDFSHFLKTFPLVSHQYCVVCSWWILWEVCRICASEAQFGGHFGPENSDLLPFTKGKIAGLVLVLLHMLIASTFRCGGIWASETQFCCHFGPPIRSKLRSLFIFRNGPTGFGLINLIYVWRCLEYRPQWPNLRVILGPWNRSFRSSVIFSKKFPLVSHHSCWHAHWEYISLCFIEMPQRPYIWA